MKNLLLILLVCMTSVAIGQRNIDASVRLKMKNGMELYGEILKFQGPDSILFKVINQEEPFMIPSSQIKKTKYISQNLIAQFSDKKWYVHPQLGIMTSDRIRGKGEPGTYASISAGWMFNSKIGIGAGVATQLFFVSAQEIVSPVFIEAKGFLSNAWFSSYYSMKFGYGIASTNDEAGIIDAKGGIHINPSIGIRYTGKKYGNFTMSFGLILQDAEFTQLGWGTDFTTYDLFYRRFVLTFGMHI